LLLSSKAMVLPLVFLYFIAMGINYILVLKFLLKISLTTHTLPFPLCYFVTKQALLLQPDSTVYEKESRGENGRIQTDSSSSCILP
jgi:hypothetical protein